MGLVGGALNLYFIYKFIRILTTPFASTDAFKLGIIDEKGKILKKHSALKGTEEKEAYTMMHRLVWKMKRLMEKIPFGKSRLASYAAALWLIKEEENFNGTDKELQESFLSFLETNWEDEALILKENYEGDMDKKTYKSLKEGIDIKKASMDDVIKDFQSSDAPQFKGKSDKKKKEMAIAAKLSTEEIELGEEVADITIRKDVGKMGKNQVAAKVMTNARKLFGLKASVNGEYVRISGPKKKVNDYLAVIIGRSSSGDATQKGPSNPQIDKMLTKSLKEEVPAHAKVMAKQGDSAETIKKMHPEITDDELEDLMGGVDEKKVPKLKFKLKQFKHVKPRKKPKEHGSYSRFSDTSGGFSFMKSKGGSGYVGAYNSAELDGTEIKEAKRRMPGNVKDYIKFVKGQGPNPEAVFDVNNVNKWVTEIKKGIKAGWVSVASTALGGEYNVSIMIKLTLEKENDWPHKILHNARFGMIRIDVDGGMEMFASGHKIKNMRKTAVKSARDAISKINTWIKKVDEEVIQSHPYRSHLNEHCGHCEMGVEEGVLEDGTTEMANQYKNDTPGQVVTEALKPLDKSVIDAFYYRKEKAGKVVSTDGDTLMKNGMGGQTIAQWLKPSGKIAISAVTDVKSTESILKYMKKSIPKGNFDKKSYKKFFGEEISFTGARFSTYITEGRPKQDDDYVPARTGTDALRAKFISTQKRLYSAKDIESMAHKYKLKLDGAPVGGKSWGGDWQIALKKGINLEYQYGPNSMYIRGWKFDKKKIKEYIAKYANEHETPRDYAPMGGKVLVGGFETAFELIGEQLELNEEFWAVIDKAKGGEVMAVTTDEKDAKSSVKMSNFSKHDYHFGKDPRTLKIVKVMGKHSQKKAEKMIGTKLSYKEEVEEASLGSMLDKKAKKLGKKKKKVDEAAPANSVAGGNVNLDPFTKKKRKNAKVQWEMFGGQKVFVVSPERFYDSRLGKARYLRYEKYVGTDKLGETIRQYGRNNPKNSIILKNSVNGAMLYLKYGRK